MGIPFPRVLQGEEKALCEGTAGVIWLSSLPKKHQLLE